MADLLGVVEAAYDLEASDGQWMQRIIDAVGPLIDVGYGAYGGAVDASGPTIRLGDILCHRGQGAFVSAVEQTSAALPDWFIERAYRQASPISSGTEVAGVEGWNELCRPYGPQQIADCVAVLAMDAHGVGVGVMAPLDRVQSYSARVRRVWARVVAHITAMLRLRRALASHTGRPGHGEAVLSPGGRVEHAEGAAQPKSARDRLREAAVARERARGRRRRKDPEEATEMWGALVAGRWSIVDRFDRDGRRFLIAHENEPTADEPRALTARERQVVTYVAMGHSNKLIAYELGLSVGAVSSYLTTATRKLGLASRIDLVRLCRASWMSERK